MKNFLKNYWALFIPLIILTITGIYLLKNSNQSSSNDENAVIGLVDADFVDVSASMPGRLEHIFVSEGQEVNAGDSLIQLSTAELQIIQSQVADAITIASNNQQLVEKGVSPEVISAAKNLQNIAQQHYELMKKTNDRFENLYADGVVSGQEKDLVQFRYQAAQKDLENARLNVQLLQKGNSKELKSTGNVLVNQAENAEKLAQQIKDNNTLKAPAAGIISTVIAKPGEMVNAGYPILTIQKKNSFSISFNIRQDKISDMPLGKVFKVRVPGAIPEQFEVKVAETAAALGYADWIPENQKGQIQMRTFKVKCIPVNAEQLKSLKVGMTAELLTQK